MATLISNAGTTQNLTGAATFAAAEAGALANVLNRNTIESLANNASVTSVTFTVTNLKVIDAVLLWVRQGAAGSTGTFKVDLQKGGVSQASVTVNRADLPAFVTGQAIGNMVPVLFKLGSNATGDGGSNWTIVLTNSNGTNAVNYAAATASTTNFTRALRTTTAATAAAADDLYVIGELTGAGTHTARTVTMDSTATTAYGSGAVNSTTVAGGGIHVSFWGTLTYGTSASTNYVLRIAGDLWVWEQGPLNAGSSGSEIPRNSTAVLEFNITGAEGDFGLRVMDNATANIAGLSRTVGKSAVSCLLTADTTSNLETNIINTLTNTTQVGQTTVLDPTNTSLLGGSQIIALSDTATNANHATSGAATGSVTGITQVFQVALARGSGTNNRFVRIQYGSTTGATSPPTNGFYADIDLQAGTIGSCTASGNGTATSSSIVALGSYFLCTIVGKASSGALSPIPAILICSAAGTTSFAGAANQSLLFYGAAVYTLGAKPTDLTVDTDTGWLSGDVVAIASTTRTNTECELGKLGSNAGASTLTLVEYPSIGTHSGTSPTQAEVILLTRNVKVRSVSTTLHAYVYITATATITFSWSEFYQIGATATGKRGIEVDALSSGTAGAKSIQNCSIHDTHFGGLYAANLTGNSLNLTFSNNMMWLNAISGNLAMLVATAITLGDWTISGNIVMRSTGNGGIQLLDMSGTCSNNTVVGGVQGITTSSGNIGTFSGNTVHSCSSTGFNMSAGMVGTLSNTTAWRNNSTGWNFGGGTISIGLTIDTITLFGNNGTNMSFAVNANMDMVIKNALSHGDTTFATTNAFNPGSFIDNVIMDTVDTTASGIKTACTNDFSATIGAGKQIVVRNGKFGGTNLISSKANWAPKSSFIAFEKFGQVAGDHRTQVRDGSWQTDTAIFNTASPSQRMTPTSATNKLESAITGDGMLCGVDSGGTVSIAVSVRKSAVGDGAAYNGNQPRLIQRANAALGQNSDVVLATYSAGTGAWNQLSATSSVATDDGCWEFIVDCDGTAGWINVDDWAVT